MRAINVNIETFNGNVYLMGTARTEQELQRARPRSPASLAASAASSRSCKCARPTMPYYAQASSGPPQPELRGEGDAAIVDDLAGGG